MHKMERSIDRGAILKQKKLKIRSNETWFSLQNRIAQMASKRFIDILLS